MTSIKPLADRAVIKPKPQEEKTKGGLFLPDTASKERPMEGEVRRMINAGQTGSV